MALIETLEKNRQIFLKFNEAKYSRFQKLILNNNIKRVINALPLLLCLNEKRIPGYIEGKMPLGIKNYTPDEETFKYVKMRFHSTSLDYRCKTPYIQMMAIMGSVGTIAYNKKSDFDYWVCVDKKSIDLDAYKKFEKKVEEVQKWATREIKTEVHIFINDIDSIKNNIFAEDEDEAFGSTTGATLKDEFYRSSIIIAGKVPLWWAIPKPITDSQYEKIIKVIPVEVMKEKFIDLGNLHEISREDFLGAALFQLIKSLGNPFKSIIKIGVLEKYLFGTEGSTLLSHKVKSSILTGKFENRIIDSYILMFEEVYNHYARSLQDRDLLKILRQNLYLKIDPQLSKYSGFRDTKKLPYKVQVMFKYVQHWGWSEKEIAELDNFSNWDYNKIMTFWNSVKKFMLLSYQKISTQFPALNLQQKVSESDFKLLSRKIRTHFSSDENKIDDYITFQETPYESLIYIDPVNVGIKEAEWKLVKKNADPKSPQAEIILKTEKNLVKLLAWASINQIFNPTFSRIKIQSGYSRIDPNHVTDLLTRISNLFATKEIKLKNEYFLKPAFNILNMIILNFNLENAASIKTVHHIFKTSWGESYIQIFNSENSLIEILQKVLICGIYLKNKDFDRICDVISPEPFKKHYKEIERLFRESYDFIVKGNSKYYLRFVAKIGDLYYTISRDRASVKISSFENSHKLLATMTLLPRQNIIQKFYATDTRISILSEIYNNKKENAFSIAIEESDDYAYFYVLNEKGNIFSFIKPKGIKDEYFLSLYNFCKKTISQLNNYDKTHVINEEIIVYNVEIDRLGKISCIDKTKAINPVFLSKYKEDRGISITASRYRENEPVYQFNFPGGAVSEFTPFNKIGSVLSANKKLLDITSGSICNLTFTDLTENDIINGSSIFFLNKYRLELIIDKLRK